MPPRIVHIVSVDENSRLEPDFIRGFRLLPANGPSVHVPEHHPLLEDIRRGGGFNAKIVCRLRQGQRLIERHLLPERLPYGPAELLLSGSPMKDELLLSFTDPGFFSVKIALPATLAEKIQVNERLTQMNSPAALTALKENALTFRIREGRLRFLQMTREAKPVYAVDGENISFTDGHFRSIFVGGHLVAEKREGDVFLNCLVLAGSRRGKHVEQVQLVPDDMTLRFDEKRFVKLAQR